MTSPSRKASRRPSTNRRSSLNQALGLNGLKPQRILKALPSAKSTAQTLAQVAVGRRLTVLDWEHSSFDQASGDEVQSIWSHWLYSRGHCITTHCTTTHCITTHCITATNIFSRTVLADQICAPQITLSLSPYAICLAILLST